MPPAGILIFGATGPTGRLVTEALCRANTPVAAVLRSDTGREDFERLGASVLRADAMRATTLPPVLESNLDSHPILLNLLGGNPFKDPSTWPDYAGVVNVTAAAVAAGYRRYILVTSIGTGASWQYVPESASYIKPIIQLKTQAEAHLKTTPLEWTIVKPGGLGPPDYEIRRGNPLITENHGVRGLIDRHDLANVIVRVLRAPRDEVMRKELYAVSDRLETHAGIPVPARI